MVLYFVSPWMAGAPRIAFRGSSFQRNPIKTTTVSIPLAVWADPLFIFVVTFNLLFTTLIAGPGGLCSFLYCVTCCCCGVHIVGTIGCTTVLGGVTGVSRNSVQLVHNLKYIGVWEKSTASWQMWESKKRVIIAPMKIAGTVLHNIVQGRGDFQRSLWWKSRICWMDNTPVSKLQARFLTDVFLFWLILFFEFLLVATIFFSCFSLKGPFP